MAFNNSIQNVLMGNDGLTRLFRIQNAEEAAELKKKRQFRKFSYRGIDLDAYVKPPEISNQSPDKHHH